MNGQVLDFGVSGKLIMNALVMFDRETGTLWSHFLSQAISGPLKGTKLENVPVTLTPWGKWVETYPDTLALNKGFPARAIRIPATTGTEAPVSSARCTLMIAYRPRNWFSAPVSIASQRRFPTRC